MDSCAAVAGWVGGTRRRAKSAVCRGASQKGKLREQVGKRARISDNDSLWTASRQTRQSVNCLRCGDSLR